MSDWGALRPSHFRRIAQLPLETHDRWENLNSGDLDTFPQNIDQIFKSRSGIGNSKELISVIVPRRVWLTRSRAPRTARRTLSVCRFVPRKSFFRRGLRKCTPMEIENSLRPRRFWRPEHRKEPFGLIPVMVLRSRGC